MPTVRALGKDIFYFFSKTLCRVPQRQRQGTRQRHLKKNSFPSATAARTRQSHFLFFFKKLFAECLPSLALGKDFLLFFKKKSLPSAMSCHSAKFPSFAECYDHCTRQINRNCNFFCIPLTQTVQIYITCHIYITNITIITYISQ